MKQTITIKNKKYNIHFGIATLRALAELWNLKTLNKVQQKVASIDGSTGELSFEAITILGDLFLAGLTSSNKTFPFTADELMDYVMFENQAALGELMNAYTKSLPKAPPVDPNVRKGRKK